MNCAYRLIWNEQLNAWVVAPEIASARGKRGRVRRCAAALMATLAIGSHAALAADLAPTALPGGGQVAAGQATIGSSGANMAITQTSQRAIINWQNFDIGSQASVNFQQPNSSAVTLNRAGGPTASRIEGQLTANGQVFLVNPSGVLFGQGARVNVGGLVASTLNIRDQDFLTGNYAFSGSGGAIENYGTINAAPGGYLAFIAPKITNAGTLNAPQGTVAMGAGKRVTLNFADNRLVGLSVAADTLDTLIENRQAIRAEGGAILLTAAGAEAVTRSVINNTGVLEASSLSSDGGRIVLTAGNDITLGAGSAIAVDGQKGGEITVQAKSGTLLADGSISARGTEGNGGSIQLLGKQVGLINAVQVDASGATGGGTVLVGGDYQGGNAEVQNAFRTYVGPQATIKADALQQGDGGKIIVWADDATRYYGAISAKGGTQGGNGGFVEVSGKQMLDFTGAVDVAAPLGAGGRVLLDPQNIVLNTTTQPSPPNNPNGTPDVAFGDPPAAGTMTIQIADITGFSELFLQATNDITVSNPITMAVNNSIRLEANNNITLATGANVTTSGTGSINFKADADNSSAGTLAMNNAALRSYIGGIALSGTSISGTGTINTTGAANANGGNIAITGTSTTGSINLTGAMTTTGGTAAANSVGRNAGNVTITGAGAVTTGAITANGNNGNGANRAGGNGGIITVTSNGALTTGNLAASGGSGGTGGGSVAAGGAAGTINVTNNSLTTGALTTGTLTARAGVARGAIVSGAAGNVNVTNKANTLLQTGAINTSGQAGGAGGNVALTSAGGVTVTSTIAAGSGALTAGTAAAGRNAGNVTIKGVNRNIAGAITASGGAAVVAGQAGGAGGNVLITGTDGTIATAGTLGTTGITARNGGASGTVASGAAGSIALEATQITATGALTTTGGANGDGGAISATTSTGSLTVNGAIAASGGTANANSAGRNAGNVTLTSSGTLNTGTNTITVNGSNGNGANQAGGNGGNVAVTSSANAVTVGAISTVGGNGVTGNANGGNAGAITLDAGGATPSITLVGNLSATGGNRVGTGTAGSGGQIWLKDAVLLNAAITASAQGGSAGVGAGANVRFDGTIDSTGAARALTVNTNAATIFGGAVGGSSALASLTTNAGGTTSIGGNVTTTGTQTYNDAVTLAGNAVLTGTTPTFASTVAGGGFDLTLNFSGTTRVNGANFTAIRNLATGNGGTTQLTGAITTSGTQTYNDAVTLTGATTLASSGNGAIAFNSTVNGAQTLAVNTTGATTFAGAVGGTTALTSVTTNAGGTTSIGGNVTTTGAQTYNDAVILTGGGTRAFASTGNSALAFNSTVDGASALVANTTGATTFAGAVGGTTALTSVTTNAGGTTSIGGNVTTTGAQTYNDAVTLTGNAVLTGTTPTFASTVAGGGFDLTLNFNGITTVNGANFTGIRNLATGNGSTTELTGAITTSGTQTYNDAVTLTGATTLASSGNGAIVFNSTVNGAQTLAVNTTGATTFAGAVGGTTALTSVTTNAGGTTSIGGGTVRTTVNQTYNDNVSLGAPTTFVTTANGSITANGSVAANGHLLTLAAGLGNVVMQNAANDLATVSVPSATNVALRDANAIDLGTSTIGANLTVSTGGAVTDSGAISVAGATTISAGAANDVTLDNLNDFAGNVSVQSGRNVRLNDINNLTLDLSSFGTLTATAAGTVTLAGPLTASGPGDAIVLSGSRFVNNAGAGALSASGGRWLVWSTDPAQDTRGSLAYNFKQYNAIYGVTPVAQPTGNGFLYSLAPTVTPGLTGTVTKIYDGSTTATLAPANLTASGAVDGDTVVLAAASATYDNRNVGTGKTVTATGITATASNGTAAVYGYTVSPTSINGPVGVITAAPLTVTAQTDTRVYNGTTSSAVAPVVSGTIYGPDAVGTAATQTYDTTNVGTGKTLTASGLVMADGNGGNNYAVTYVADTTGVITPFALTGSITANNKVYDGTTVATIASRSLTGVFSGDSVSYIGGTATFADKNASVGKTVTATGLGLSGTDAGNYTVNTTATTTANITPASLVITADDANRPVNTPNPQFSASYAGFVGGETPAVLNGLLSFSTPAMLTSPVGIYPITPYGQSSGNYTITYVDGKLTIQGTPVVTQPLLPREVVSQQAIAAQYTDPTMPVDTLSGLQYVVDGEYGGKDEKVATSVVRVVGSGIRLPN